jgi:hypothetical protein
MILMIILMDILPDYLIRGKKSAKCKAAAFVFAE